MINLKTPSLKKAFQMKKTIVIFVFMFVSSVAQAALVNWKIMFFDENNTQVGEGLFSYDTETENTFSSYHPALPHTASL